MNIKRYRFVIGPAVAGFVLCLYFLAVSGQLHSKVSVAKSGFQGSLSKCLFPYKGGYTYPGVPRELRISPTDKPQRLLRTAKKRSDLVTWADSNNIWLVQNVGPNAFLLADDVGSGGAVWVLYIYLRCRTEWRLVYVGNGGLGPTDYFDCVYFDVSRRAMRFATKSGTVLSTVYIGTQLDLLSIQ